MKLNLGSGQLNKEGYINIDLSGNADLIHDLRTPLPFEENSVDEINATHLIESFYAWEFPAILKDWRRVLKPAGVMTIEFTVLSDSINLYLNATSEQERNWGHWGLYGDQATPVDPIILHHYVYEKEELEKLLNEVGFNVSFTREGIVHCPKRDLIAVCS